jgi:hypothetical protein
LAADDTARELVAELSARRGHAVGHIRRLRFTPALSVHKTPRLRF